MQDSITEASIIVKWRPGFNGGLQQTFMIQYKKDNGDWIYTPEIIDSQQEEINYTLTQLVPGSIYTAQMFAKNVMGTSSFSNQITFTTSSNGTKVQVSYLPLTKCLGF